VIAAGWLLDAHPTRNAARMIGLATEGSVSAWARELSTTRSGYSKPYLNG
jgi:hypothetical protein